MTTDREQIIAAAHMVFLDHNDLTFTQIKTFYAIALEHGRQLEREDCILDLHRNADQTLEEIIAAIRARGDSK